MALAPLPRAPSFCSHYRQLSVRKPRLAATAGNPCAPSLAVVQAAGACPPEHAAVSQPCLGRDTAGVRDRQQQWKRRLLQAPPLLLKFLVADGQMVVLVDRWVRFTGARRGKGGGQRGEAHSPSWRAVAAAPRTVGLRERLCRGSRARSGHTAARQRELGAGAIPSAPRPCLSSYTLLGAGVSFTLQRRSGLGLKTSGAAKSTVALGNLLEWWLLSLINLYRILMGICLAFPSWFWVLLRFPLSSG